MKTQNNKATASAGENSQKQKAGFREWAPGSCNIGIGCSHNCIYCCFRLYALRFRGVKSREDWAKERLKEPPPRIRKFEGTVMMPTAHDVTPFYLPAVEAQLKALLEVGNQVLIVTKPHLECIRRLCVALAPYKQQVLFRFTIGTLDRKLTKLWEPGATAPAERFACLKHAFRRGFATSVSMEPMLAGTEDAVATFYKLIPFVTETIWFGKMNHVNRWGPATPEIATACWYIRKLQCDAAILDLVRRLGSHPQVKWKDSIRQVIRDRNATG
jgi:DNA repair photolyase